MHEWKEWVKMRVHQQYLAYKGRQMLVGWKIDSYINFQISISSRICINANCFSRSCVNRRIEKMFLWTKYVHDHWINFTHFLNFNLSLFANSEIPKSIQNQIVYDKNVGILHGSYRWIIMLEKYGHPDLNIFHLKWIISTHGNWKNQNPGGRFGPNS